MSGFRVDPDDFHAAAGALEQSGADLHEQWQQLKQETMSIRFGETDMVAPLIQMTLMGAVMIADSCFGTSKDALTGHSGALRSAATQYASAEETSTALFKAG